MQLAGLWTANNDARAYTILGDPAVRLPVAGVGAKPFAVRPTIESASQRVGESAHIPEEDISFAVSFGLGPQRPGEEIEVEQPQEEDELGFGVSFGLRPQPLSPEPSAKEISLKEAVKKFARDLAQKVSTLVADVSELEIRTYTAPADQVETFSKGQSDFAEALADGDLALRAYTRVSFEGDTTICAPTDASGEIDESVWELHEASVQQAIANRADIIKSVGEAAWSTLKALEPASKS